MQKKDRVSRLSVPWVGPELPFPGSNGAVLQVLGDRGEFIGKVPEPASLSLLAIGLLTGFLPDISDMVRMFSARVNCAPDSGPPTRTQPESRGPPD